MLKLFCLILLVRTSIGGNLGDFANFRSEVQYITDQIFNRGFSINARPPSEKSIPTNVNVSMFLSEIDLCCKKQELTISGYFRQFWHDSRLKTEDEEFTTVLPDMFENPKIWIPDTFIVGDKYGFLYKIDPATKARSAIKIKGSGDIISSMRIRSQIPCLLPRDKTDGNEFTCKVSFESWFHYASQISYNWKDDVLISEEAKDILKAKGWNLLSNKKVEEIHMMPTGEYSSVGLELTFKRIVK